MLSDRSYMRNDYPRERTSVLTWVLAAVVGAFVLELLLGSPWFHSSDQLAHGLAVSIPGLSAGWFWTLLSHSLLHSQENLFHVGLVLVGLFLLGRELEPLLGPRRFLGLLLGAVAFGAVMWAAVNWRQGGLLMGGMAGVAGLLAFLAALQPNREINFLLFFFFPVALRLKHIAAAWLAFDLAALVGFEVLGHRLPLDYTPSAHLGGMMVGWIYFRYLYRQAGPSVVLRQRPAKIPAAERDSEDEVAAVVVPSAQERRAHLRAEVDRILDKINSHGLGSLTKDERRRLDEAKQELGPR